MYGDLASLPLHTPGRYGVQSGDGCPKHPGETVDMLQSGKEIPMKAWVYVKQNGKVESHVIQLPPMVEYPDTIQIGRQIFVHRNGGNYYESKHYVVMESTPIFSADQQKH